MQVVPDGHPCECGRAGCWEQYASGNSLVRYARSRLDSPSYTQQTTLEEACGGQPEQLTGPMITEAARSGDRLAQRAFTVVGEWLGVGIANLVAAFDPEVVVVGGGVSAAGDLLLDPARAALRDSLVAASEREIPEIVRARFGPEAGVVGAAAMIRAAVAG